MSHPDRRQLGVEGEAAAAAWYRHRGFLVQERNWRCRDGEIDLVLVRPGLLVVCEVKTRSSTRFGGGAEAVDWRKQQRVRLVTRRYLHQRHGDWVPNLRFDVAVVVPGPRGYAVQVIEAAF